MATPPLVAVPLRIILWTWGARVLLLAVFGLAVSELFVFKGFIFQLLTPASVFAEPPPLSLPGAETERVATGPTFDPRDRQSVREQSNPSELSAEETQELVRDAAFLKTSLDGLIRDAPRFEYLYREADRVEVLDSLWLKLAWAQLKNSEAPKLWCKMLSEPGRSIEQEDLLKISTAVATARFRILGGVASSADAAYVRATQSWLDPHLKWITAKQMDMAQLRALLQAEGIQFNDPPQWLP